MVTKRLASHRRPELRERLEEAGFTVRMLSHFMATLVPVLLVMRGVGQLLPRPAHRRRERQTREFGVVPGLNGVLRSLCTVERRLLRVGSLPFGSSIIAVAVRTGQPA